MKKEIVFSVHQPNFLPWLGYFNKIAESDVFVILDDVLIPRGTSIANKNRILTSNGILELTFPISHPKGNNRLTAYKDVLFVDDKSKQKILKTIQSSYSKSPFYDEVYPFIEQVFEANSFCELNETFIIELCKKFELKTQILKMSDLEVEGAKNELIVGIGKKVEGTVYLSGTGAKSYNDPAYFKEHNIELIYQNYSPLEYTQYNSKVFNKNLSVIDYLFNQGFVWPVLIS